MTSPAHVQRILRDNAPNHVRDGKGVLWGSIKPLFTTAVPVRLLVPFVPNHVPMPGDRAFRDAVRQIDDVAGVAAFLRPKHTVELTLTPRHPLVRESAGR